MLRRVRDEVLDDLPDRIDNNFFVGMTDPQWKAYEEFRMTVAKLVSLARRRPRLRCQRLAGRTVYARLLPPTLGPR